MFQTTNQQCFHINEQQILQEDLDVLTSPMEHHCWSGGKELQTQGMAGPMQSLSSSMDEDVSGYHETF